MRTPLSRVPVPRVGSATMPRRPQAALPPNGSSSLLTTSYSLLWFCFAATPCAIGVADAPGSGDTSVFTTRLGIAFFLTFKTKQTLSLFEPGGWGDPTYA